MLSTVFQRERTVRRGPRGLWILLRDPPSRESRFRDSAFFVLPRKTACICIGYTLILLGNMIVHKVEMLDRNRACLTNDLDYPVISVLIELIFDNRCT